jgi:hypothetical protein
MFKVFAFLKRNTALLTLDEYRAGHIGYHTSHSRRLLNIRGYCVNVRSSTPLRDQLGSLYEEVTVREPASFDAWWDGCPQVLFDDERAWTRSGDRERTRAGPEGLVEDTEWALADGPYLFEPAPLPEATPPPPTASERDPYPGRQFQSYHLHMEEHVVVPVIRPEAKLTKLMQFFKRKPGVTPEAFRAALLGPYAYESSRFRGLRGYIINLRDPDIDAGLRGYFPSTHYAFSAEGRAKRRAFCELWDGASELLFDSMADFIAARSDPAVSGRLLAQERALFSSCWYVEVDESVIVLPNRGPVPDFYYR